MNLTETRAKALLGLGLNKKNLANRTNAQLARALNQCAGASLPLPPMNKTVVNGYEIYTAVGSPLTARQFVNLFAGKTLAPIARKVGLVPTGISKRVLKGLILKKLTDLKVPEPIRRVVPKKRTRDQSIATNRTNQSLATGNQNQNRTNQNQPPATGNANQNQPPATGNANQNQPPASGNRVKLNEPELNFGKNGTATYINRETVGNKTFVVPEVASKAAFPKMARGNSAQNFEALNLGKHTALSFSAGGAGGRPGTRNGALANFRLPNMNFPKKNLKIPTLNSQVFENSNFKTIVPENTLGSVVVKGPGGNTWTVTQSPQLVEARRELEQTRAAAGPQSPVTQELEVKVRELEKSQLPKATGAGNTSQVPRGSGNGNRTTSQVPRVNGNGNRTTSQVPRGNGNGNRGQPPTAAGNQKLKNEANAERRRIESNAARARANLEANARRVQNNLKQQLVGAKNANKEREIQARLEKNRINLETKKAELEARTERNKAALAARVAERQANVNLRKAELMARAASASGRSGPGLWNRVRNMVKKKPELVTRERAVEVLMEAGASRAQINEVRTTRNWQGVINRLAQGGAYRFNSPAQGEVPRQNGKQRTIRNVGEIRIPKGLEDSITKNLFENKQPVYRVKYGKLYSYYGVDGLNTWLKDENRPVLEGENITNMEKGRAVLVNLKNFGNVSNKQLQERLMSLAPYVFKNGNQITLQRLSGGQRLPITNMKLFKESMGTNKHYEELVTFLKSTNSVTRERVEKLVKNLGLRRGDPAPAPGNNGEPELPSTSQFLEKLDEKKVYIVRTRGTDNSKYYIFKNGTLHEVSSVNGLRQVFRNGDKFLQIGDISIMYGNKLNAIQRLTGNKNKNYSEGEFTEFESGDALARNIVDRFLANKTTSTDYRYFVNQHFGDKKDMKYKNFVRLVPHGPKAEFVIIQQKLANAGVPKTKITQLKEASIKKARSERRVPLNVFRENVEEFLKNHEAGKKLNEAAGAQLKARINLVRKQLRNAGMKNGIEITGATINSNERKAAEGIALVKKINANMLAFFKKELATVPQNKRKELMNEFNRMRTNNTTPKGLELAYNSILAKVNKLRARTPLQRLANGEFSNEAYARVHALLLANHPKVIERFDTQIEKQGGQELSNNMKQKYFTNAHTNLARSLRKYVGMSQHNLNAALKLKDAKRLANESLQRRLQNKKKQNQENSSKGAQNTLTVKLQINSSTTVAALNTLKNEAYKRNLRQYFNKKRAELTAKEENARIAKIRQNKLNGEQRAASVAAYKKRINAARTLEDLQKLKVHTYTGDAKENINRYVNAKIMIEAIESGKKNNELNILKKHTNDAVRAAATKRNENIGSTVATITTGIFTRVKNEAARQAHEDEKATLLKSINETTNFIELAELKRRAETNGLSSVFKQKMLELGREFNSANYNLSNTTKLNRMRAAVKLANNNNTLRVGKAHLEEYEKALRLLQNNNGTNITTVFNGTFSGQFKNVKALLEQVQNKRNAAKAAAAITIQKVVRGKLGRKAAKKVADQKAANAEARRASEAANRAAANRAAANRAAANAEALRARAAANANAAQKATNEQYKKSRINSDIATLNHFNLSPTVFENISRPEVAISLEGQLRAMKGAIKRIEQENISVNLSKYETLIKAAEARLKLYRNLSENLKNGAHQLTMKKLKGIVNMKNQPAEIRSLQERAEAQLAESERQSRVDAFLKKYGFTNKQLGALKSAFTTGKWDEITLENLDISMRTNAVISPDVKRKFLNKLDAVLSNNNLTSLLKSNNGGAAKLTLEKFRNLLLQKLNNNSSNEEVSANAAKALIQHFKEGLGFTNIGTNTSTRTKAAETYLGGLKHPGKATRWVSAFNKQFLATYKEWMSTSGVHSPATFKIWYKKQTRNNTSSRSSSSSERLSSSSSVNTISTLFRKVHNGMGGQTL